MPQTRIVGVELTNNADTLFADWKTLTLLAPGADREPYQDGLAAGDPGLKALPPRDTQQTPPWDSPARQPS
jgi:putative ABC transport system permease protein